MMTDRFLATPPTTAAGLAGLIDHTILKPETRLADVARICDEAVLHHFCSVCVNPIFIPEVAARLSGSGVKTCSVVGFPLGATPSFAKATEAEWVVAHGAEEVDMVLAIGRLKDGDRVAVLEDIRAVRKATQGAILKVILETCFLTDAEKRLACELSEAAGADFVKTSTGFGSGGATAADITLMREVVGPRLGVKASGGIRSTTDAFALINAGASRIGASASVAIIQGLTSNATY
jgi:deoxyribose-phosphate aldolase